MAFGIYDHVLITENGSSRPTLSAVMSTEESLSIDDTKQAGGLHARLKSWSWTWTAAIESDPKEALETRQKGLQVQEQANSFA
jgi:hypothetical protein